MSRFFITSSGTDIGKTLVTTSLCWQLRNQGKSVHALKPVMSGYDPDDHTTDSALILASNAMEITTQNIEAISPWRYRAALAPNMAAAREGNPIDMDQLIAYCEQQASNHTGITLVEGVGGVMAPITDNHTMLDWMQRLLWPTILVGGSYLGAMSHILSAYEVLIQRGIMVAGIVVSESDNSEVSLTDTISVLEKFLPTAMPVITVPRLESHPELWTKAPSMSGICSV